MEEDQCPPSSTHRSRTKPNPVTAAPESAQPWTATRCHRLLRPLLAHIAALRKDKEWRALLLRGSASAALAQTARPRKRSYPGSDSDYADKKTCRKYSRKASRRRSSSDRSTTPQRNAQKQRRQPDSKATGDVVLPTPFLRRIRNPQPSSPNQTSQEPFRDGPAPGTCYHPRVCYRTTRCSFELALADLRPTMDPERHGLHDAVFRAFDSILRATSLGKNHAAGSKSLLAMCLRKVPAYMAALEEWDRKDARENGTKSTVQGAGISFEIYSELESLGAVEGWRHLRLLVRAHAVTIVQDAVSEGLLEDPVTDLLIRVCLEYMPPTECADLIDNFVIRQYPKPHSTDDDLFSAVPALQPLLTLRSCKPLAASLMPGTLAKLLGDELLPADWILTKSFISLWPLMVHQIADMKPCEDTVEFVVTTLELLCELASPRRPRGVPQTRLRGKAQNILVSAIAALGSVVLLSEEGSSESAGVTPTTRAATLRRRLEYVVTTCWEKLRRRKKGGRKLGTYLLALCSFLSLENDSLSAATIEGSWMGVQHCRGNASLMLQYDATTALMSAVAHYCSRGTGLAPNIHLSQFCDKLETLHLPGGALSNMRVDGALRLAEHTGDLRDVAFAESLWAKAALGGTPLQTRGKPSPFSGMRWDEGICEWVAATPATDLRAAVRICRVKRGEKNLDPADGFEAETDQDQTASEIDEVDARSSELPADDESDGDSETQSSEADDVSLGTGAPSGPSPKGHHTSSSSSSDSESDSGGGDHGGGSNNNNILRKPAKPPSSPPLAPGGFLAARPRRLVSRRMTRGGHDELAFDQQNGGADDDDDSGKENWLCRKKPARFRPSPVGPPTAKRRKRVARASLVYLQPLEGSRTLRQDGDGGGSSSGSVGEESDDELSIL